VDDFDDDREEQFDLLTAAVIGVAIGAGIALLVRRGPSGNRPLRPVMDAVGRGAKWSSAMGLEGARWAGDTIPPYARRARKGAARGARWAREHSEPLLERLPALDEVTDTVRDYVDAAREAINETVEHEARDLRKAIRRQRKRIGI
jgi:gas vesicle protein